MNISDQGASGAAMVKRTQSCTPPAWGMTEISYADARAAAQASSGPRTSEHRAARWRRRCAPAGAGSCTGNIRAHR
jgi:hypothetical protein